MNSWTLVWRPYNPEMAETSTDTDALPAMLGTTMYCESMTTRVAPLAVWKFK